MNDKVKESVGKKRVRHEEDYKRNKIKHARVAGESYTNYKGNLLPEKRVEGSCNCKSKYAETITEEEKCKIFKQFRTIATKDQQDLYLQGLITAEKIHRRRKRTDDGNSRCSSFIYHILVGNERIVVCRKAFVSLYAVSDERVKRIRNLLLMGEIPKDKRGRERSANAMGSSEIISVINHISSFPVKHTHYGVRECKYLNAELNVMKMYSLFLEKYPTTKIKYEYYNVIFKENFKLSFGRPQVDIYNECELLSLKIHSKTLNDTAKRVAAAELLVHKRRSNKFYSALRDSTKKCQEDQECLALSFDFMQNLQLPRCPTQDMFYLSLLTVNVFAIHNLKTNNAVFFVYHEGLAKKGSNEICSFVLEYIHQYVPETVQELHLFCDNCPGQNKNRAVVRLCAALVDSGKFQKVELFFPIRGHSFLPGHRDFATIKRQLRKSDGIYRVHQYVEMIATACKKSGRFTVHETDGKDIIDFKSWWTSHYKKSVISVETSSRSVPRSSKESFSISKYHYFLFDRNLGKGVISTRTYIGGLNINTFPLLLPGTSNVEFPTKLAYPEGKVPISTKKMAMIKKSAQFVPEDDQTQNYWKAKVSWAISDTCNDNDN